MSIIITIAVKTLLTINLAYQIGTIAYAFTSRKDSKNLWDKI